MVFVIAPRRLTRALHFHCLLLSLLLLCKVQSHDHVLLRCSSKSKGLQQQFRQRRFQTRQRQRRRQRRRRPMMILTKPENSQSSKSRSKIERELITIRGGSVVLTGDTPDSNMKTAMMRRDGLWNTIKSFWSFGIIGFGGTPTVVALLQNKNNCMQGDDSVLELVATMYAIPGPTSMQLVLATAMIMAQRHSTQAASEGRNDVMDANAASVGAVAAGILALFLYTSPGFLILTMCARQCLRQSMVTSATTTATTFSRNASLGLAQRLGLVLPGIQPVTLAWTIQKSVIPILSRMDGVQRTIVACCCGLASMTTTRRNGETRLRFLAIPFILALGGFGAVCKDVCHTRLPSNNRWAIPSSSSSSSPLNTSKTNIIEGLERATRQSNQNIEEVLMSDVDATSENKGNGLMSDVMATPENKGTGLMSDVDAIPGYEGFRSSPVQPRDAPDPFDYLNNLDNVAEELEAVEAKFDQYLSEQFDDDVQDVEQYTEFFAATSPLIEKPKNTKDLQNPQSSSSPSQSWESSSLRENRQSANNVSGRINDHALEPGESNGTGLSQVENRTNPLFQQQTRGGSIVLVGISGPLNENKPRTPGLRALVAWLLALFVTTFIKWDNDLYKIFAMNYRMGSGVFGGEPALLKLMATELIPINAVSEEIYFLGARLCQTLPGSECNVAAYVGALLQGWKGAMMAHLGMAMPGFLLVLAVLPQWSRLRREDAWFQSVSRGVTAAAVGLLCAVCLSTYGNCIHKGSDVVLFVGTLCMVPFTSVPAPILMALGGIAGALLSNMCMDRLVYQ